VLEIENIDPLNVIDTIVLHSDLPTVDSSQVGTWFLCQQAASLGKVVFTGDGADELFGGYPTHTANALLDSRMGQILRKLSEISAGLASRAPYGEGSPGWRHKITRILRYAQYGLPEAAFRWRTLVDQSLFPELFDDLAFDPWPMFMSSDYDYAQFSPLDRCLALEVELLLPQGEVARLDRMSMAHSLEARPPFLDHRIAEFAFRLPFHAKWSWLAGGKRPIVRWLRKTLPTWTRQPKKGFNHPVQNWFMGPLGELLLDEASCNGAALSIRFNKLEEMLRDHRLRRYDYSFELWTLLFLLIWIRVHRVSL
jgi:asparagine synthase (glutamine-hydrolysing)